VEFAELDPNVIIPSVIAAYAAIKASRAEKNTKPVSNGFTGEMRHSLGKIREEIAELRRESKEDWRDHYNNHHRPQ
jgi:hypothetical protein